MWIFFRFTWPHEGYCGRCIWDTVAIVFIIIYPGGVRLVSAFELCKFLVTCELWSIIEKTKPLYGSSYGSRDDSFKKWRCQDVLSFLFVLVQEAETEPDVGGVLRSCTRVGDCRVCRCLALGEERKAMLVLVMCSNYRTTCSVSNLSAQNDCCYKHVLIFHPDI